MKAKLIVRAIAAAVAAACFAAALAQMPRASESGASRILEEEERMREVLREHCSTLNSRRLFASRNNAWRNLVDMSKSYADACAGVDDRFQISRAYEDMAYGYMMLGDLRMAMRWAQSCIESNGLATGCYARKAELLFGDRKMMETRATLSRGIMAGERAVGMTKVEQERVRMNKPDPRALQVYRTRYLRRMEELDIRLGYLEEGLRTLKQMEQALDIMMGDNSVQQ